MYEIPFSLKIVERLIDLRVGYAGKLAKLASRRSRIFDQRDEDPGGIACDA
jgi:hypothetical protein